jgi:uncharacterized membrane protein YraQ (UPF0718 family)
MAPPSCCSAENIENMPQKSHGPDHHDQGIDLMFWGSFVVVSILYFLGMFFPEKIEHLPWLTAMAHTSHNMVHDMWWGIVIGALFIGLLAKIPRVFIISLLGEGGTTLGLLRATGAGVLLDLCSHGILMIATKLYERGASAGQTIAFLLASPWNSFSITLILVGVIGLKWTLAFIGFSMLIAIATGWVFDRLVDKKILPSNHNKLPISENFSFWNEAKNSLSKTTFNLSFYKDLVITGFKDSKMVVRWLLFGILLAGGLRAFLDPSQFEQYFGPTVFGLIVTIFIATVIEVCSEGSTPIAADILNRASAPGNSFAFLMAGVATDYTEVMILKDTTKSWKLALFLPLVTVPQVTLVAYLINTYA